MKKANSEVTTGFLATLLNNIGKKVPGVSTSELKSAFASLSPEIAAQVSAQVLKNRTEKIGAMLEATEEQDKYKPY